MTQPDIRKPDSEIKQQPAESEPKRTPGEDAKHAVKTGLPPGVDVEDWKDPGKSLGGAGGSNNT